jgi:thioredoxin-like negative regulator of GroEL
MAFRSGLVEKAFQESIEAFRVDKDFMDGKIRQILAALLIYSGEESRLAEKYRKEILSVL